MLNGRARETLEQLDWWGIPRPLSICEAEQAKHRLLARLEQCEQGSPGYLEWRAAGFELLRFWIDCGNEVTATKINQSRTGGKHRPSAAVAFLAEQLPRIPPGLGRRNAIDAAYTIARAWNNQRPPMWVGLI
jgi:hypothetical protein